MNIDDEPLNTFQSDRNKIDKPIQFAYILENRPRKDNSRQDYNNDNLNYKTLRLTDDIYDESEYYFVNKNILNKIFDK